MRKIKKKKKLPNDLVVTLASFVYSEVEVGVRGSKDSFENFTGRIRPSV